MEDKPSVEDYPFRNGIWPYRYERLAEVLEKGKTVADVGAGLEHIKGYIEPARYYPLDIYRLSGDTLVVDLDNEPLPQLPERVDYIVAMGIFEYLVNGESVLGQLHQYGDTLVATCYYYPTQMKAWKRHWSMEEFESALRDNGWRITHKENFLDLPEYLYVCESVATEEHA